MIPRAAYLALVVFFLCAPSQQLQSQSFCNDVWHAIRRSILPDYISSTYELRAFISRQHAMPYTRNAHLERLDRIWNYAVFLSEGDIETALFISTVATIPYHTFPAYIPLAGIPLTIPVSSESRTAFEMRYENLPALLYMDSPSGGDRDKLPHFFGASYIQYRGRSPLIAALAGESIEIAEKLFKLEGAYDIRDIDVNYRGIAFGRALRNRKPVAPSQYFNKFLPGETNEPR